MRVSAGAIAGTSSCAAPTPLLPCAASPWGNGKPSLTRLRCCKGGGEGAFPPFAPLLSLRFFALTSLRLCFLCLFALTSLRLCFLCAFAFTSLRLCLLCAFALKAKPRTYWWGLPKLLGLLLDFLRLGTGIPMRTPPDLPAAGAAVAFTHNSTSLKVCRPNYTTSVPIWGNRTRIFRTPGASRGNAKGAKEAKSAKRCCGHYELTK